MTDEQLSAVVIVIFATTGAIAGLRWRSLVVGTTLTAVAVWTSVAFASLAAVELFAGSWGEAHADLSETWRFAAATSMFCPLVARLGAKRPQHRAWQFVVLTLWLVLASPAAERFVLQPNQPLGVLGARSWFLMVLIVIGLLDRLLTRYALAAILAAIGQVLLLREYLPLPTDVLEFDHGYCVGVVLVSLSVMLEVFDLPRRTVSADDWDMLWLDFRDRFGTLWGLRILERLNDAATKYEWNLRLTWVGFRGLNAEHGKMPDEFSTTFDNLLRRFVSPEWIASRRGNDVDCKRR